ncbi:MAG TPA: hypothetical protein VE820_05945 [Sphingomicrobium sp.]|jgi:hypothetical protein|nr:hypothetical protein [Sphingomicrobium sp.]
MIFAAKCDVPDPNASVFHLVAAKTMYGGKNVAPGDTIFLFASENEGGRGLVARGIVTSANRVPRTAGVERQTPRVTVTIERTAPARRPLGRAELKSFTDWHDGKPETELSFKFYRQATNKIVGISAVTAQFLDTFF